MHCAEMARPHVVASSSPSSPLSCTPHHTQSSVRRHSPDRARRVSSKTRACLSRRVAMYKKCFSRIMPANPTLYECTPSCGRLSPPKPIPTEAYPHRGLSPTGGCASDMRRCWSWLTFLTTFAIVGPIVCRSVGRRLGRCTAAAPFLERTRDAPPRPALTEARATHVVSERGT